jgi:uncharacterized membrane protein (DUF2068 family)
LNPEWWGKLTASPERLTMTDSDRTSTTEETHLVARRRTLRAIAVFEAIKGIAALAATVGVLELMHRDVRHLALELIGHFGLRPEARYPEIVLHYADLLPGANVRGLVVLALAYIVVRLVEAYGLWNDRAWGEWLGALSGGLYIPFEINHMMHRPTTINAMVLAGNIFVVGFLVFQLWRRRKAHTAFPR